MKGYYKYIDDVLSGKIVVGNLMYKSVERFETLRKREDIYFDEECLDEAIQFISLIKHFLGKSKGKPFKLEPWQQFVVGNILALKYKKNGLRICRETYIQIARKAGKDAFIAALSIYMMLIDGEAAPEIACLANTRDQARILFEYITEFSKGLDKNSSIIKHYRNYIKSPLNNGTVKIFSADASKLDGLNVSMGVIDEFHEAKDRKLYDVIKSSMGMREQPLMVVITTAGFNLESPCYDMYKLGIEILNGVKHDDSFFPFIFTLDEGDDITDPNNWYKCQPNLDITVTKEFMSGEILKMENDKTAEVGIKTKTFNMWCTSSSVWIKPEEIVKCMQDIKLEDYVGYTCVCGIDLGSVNDLTAISFMINTADNKKVFFNYSFLPEETYKNHELKPLYDKFITEGSLIITNGNVCDYDIVANKIREVNEIIPVTAIYYDKYNSTQFAINMTDMGYNMVVFSQSIGNYNACTKEYQRLVLEQQCVIQKQSNYLWQMSCVELKMDFQGNVKPAKGQWRTKKIDNVISSTTALGGFLKEGIDNDFDFFILQSTN